ncbi:uncharacterized protein BDZ99DRAFT_484920 [Mytilinidion resinicola]|uniref:PhoD-like phosphatase domain-containing protein n=1 Tax=Mytilinidion resinicola TaxID=574789 RepID=A0A6A6Z6G5_9PEZI|nr:uncharacterized protein BDZ99DRAFT_484920 [Mytilinidion resinicola]KAF2816263.1 hypothetical protein BDZ99DRAFT_484920 [Mytilinidion resinicola]
MSSSSLKLLSAPWLCLAEAGTVPQTPQNGIHSVGAGTSDEFEVLCGPLLNYKRMSNAASQAPTWHGSILIVTTPGQHHPELTLRCLGPAVASQTNGSASVTGSGSIPGTKLYEDPRKTFWRFLIDVPFQNFEAKWEYSIASTTRSSGERKGGPNTFVVPSIAQSMRILFHSCNGFSVGTNVDAWSGPALWNDVLRMHQQKPFHVMIGGGDQIYNDGVRVDGPLRAWTDIGNPHKRRGYPFNEQLRAECDDYYFNNYIGWYGTKPFSDANAQIPQLNIWDDHDIIDGFGSYTDRFMRCAVFRGIGGVAHKYYLLFQHHIPPPKSTFTTDAPNTMKVGLDGTPEDPIQMKDTFVKTDDKEDPSYIIGSMPGPYVEERSRNLYCQLGARIAFCGIDARTERTRHQINYPETYKQIFDRLSAEFAANKEIKHLILLLGVPIAYPRLQWLENIFSSPIIAPIKFLNKRFGFAGGVFNKFDGNVDLLDDLDDHYTAHQHKHERKELILQLQDLAKKHSVRITILGGDVHLAAIGRFYSNAKLGIPAERDFRYMPNVISSAITNKPPPQAVANLLASRNKIHHLDHDTDETLLELFDHDPGHKPGAEVINGNGNGNRTGTNGKIPKKTSDKNHATMPSRNYAIIAESQEDPATVAAAVPAPAPTTATNGDAPAPVEGTQELVHGAPVSAVLDVKANARKPMHAGENGAGTFHPAATGLQPTGLCGAYGLDVTIRVEITPNDKEGHTEGYGFSVPALDAGAYLGQGTTW